MGDRFSVRQSHKLRKLSASSMGVLYGRNILFSACIKYYQIISLGHILLTHQTSSSSTSFLSVCPEILTCLRWKLTILRERDMDPGSHCETRGSWISLWDTWIPDLAVRHVYQQPFGALAIKNGLQEHSDRTSQNMTAAPTREANKPINLTWNDAECTFKSEILFQFEFRGKNTAETKMMKAKHKYHLHIRHWFRILDLIGTDSIGAIMH